MIFNTQEILFFSLKRNTAISFERFIRYSNKEFIEKHSLFQLIREQNGTAKTFKHFQDLLFFLENLNLIRLSNLILIIDIYSLDSSTEKDNRQFFKEIIVRYPEVKINFLSFKNDWMSFFTMKDESTLNSTADESSKQTIIVPSIHSFDLFNKDSFDLLIRGKSNLFDASNLRNYLKQDFYNTLNVKSNNFKAQESRLKNFALAVEEEISLAYFNGYALYANGYRSMPITSYIELDSFKKYIGPNIYGKNIIVRDYDLQFEDNEIDADLIFKLRGLKKQYRKIKEENKWKGRLYSFFRRQLKNLNKEYSSLLESYESINVNNGEKNLKEFYKKKLEFHKKNYPFFKIFFGLPKIDIYWELKNDFWNCCDENYTTFFITRFDDKKTIEKPYIDNKYFKNKVNNSGIAIDRKAAVLRGISKPISGIYSLHEISEIENTYNAAKDEYDISTERESKDSHSVSPFIYHIAENMIKRAQKYYDEQMFLLSALLAKEANEILNGFHFTLTLEATYLQTVAETNLETEILGTEEDKIALNTSKRLTDVKIQVERLCKSNNKAKKNVLTQIYNDVRHICRQKEQFKAAEIALAELINTRFGNSLIFWKSTK